MLFDTLIIVIEIWNHRNKHQNLFFSVDVLEKQLSGHHTESSKTGDTLENIELKTGFCSDLYASYSKIQIDEPPFEEICQFQQFAVSRDLRPGPEVCSVHLASPPLVNP